MFGSGGCARCSMCGINYPLNKSVCEVLECGERLSRVSNDEPDANWKERVASLNARLMVDDSGIPPIDELHEHRAVNFERLGFTEHAASALASAKDDLGFPLYWGRVAAVLRRGVTHELALRIFV